MIWDVRSGVEEGLGIKGPLFFDLGLLFLFCCAEKRN